MDGDAGDIGTRDCEDEEGEGGARGGEGEEPEEDWVLRVTWLNAHPSTRTFMAMAALNAERSSLEALCIEPRCRP